jgi:cytochrome oxidase Cu insertion factor (SCO1/SenC/PrrC family)
VRRRSLAYGAAGMALAGVLAAVLFAGLGTGGGVGAGNASSAANQPAAAPGLNGPTTSLLSLYLYPTATRRAAPAFGPLIDQHGYEVSLASFRGKVVVLTFNDDQCTDVCTLLAEDIVAANADLGALASDVVWLGVNANPFYPGVSSVRSWTDQHGLANQPNWYFVTGSPASLQQVWKQYGVVVELDQADRSVQHGDEIFFIDPRGREAALGQFGDQSADTAEFAHGLAQMAADLLPSRPRVAGPEAPVPSVSNAAVGAQAPAVLDLASLRGRAVVINFWSTTCAPCVAELPALEAAYRAEAGKVAFLGVDVAEPAEAAQRVAASAGVTYPLVSDPGGSAAGAFRITATPYTIVLDPTGLVVIRHPGPFTAEQLEYLLMDYK